MRRGSWLVAAAVLAASLGGAVEADVGLERHADRVDVTIDGKPFTSYRFGGVVKPILFPVIGPTGAGLTRQWPMVEGVAGEPADHPHHESLWFTYGAVNGHDFWSSHSRAQKPAARSGPRVEQTAIVASESGPTGVLETANRWLAADGKPVCTDTRRMLFAADDGARTIDYAITIRADHGPVVFGDTKEGAMGLRVRPELQPKDSNGSRGAAGVIVDADGRRNAAVWGKTSRWVDYSGPLDGGVAGVAILDHPGNLRHPTHWHAREYGLFAANPFGSHDFGGPKEQGGHTIPAGGSLTLRYLFVLHQGDAATAAIEDRWRRWAEATGGGAK